MIKKGKNKNKNVKILIQSKQRDNAKQFETKIKQVTKRKEKEISQKINQYI